MRENRKKSMLLLVSLIMVLTVVVGGTLAYLVAQTGDVSNSFTVQRVPVEVTSDNKIRNISKTDDGVNDPGTPAYIRAAIVANVVKVVDGKEVVVYSQNPMINVSGTNWTTGSDGFYYYNFEVAAGNTTEPLSCSPALSSTIPNEYTFTYEILAQSIQARGADSKGNKPIELAWGVDIENGVVKAATITN